MREIEWSSPSRRKGAVGLLVSIFQQAIVDEIITHNPALSIPAAKLPKRVVDPLINEEADLIIGHIYKTTSGLTAIYAAYFEFCFYTAMRPGEVAALRWSEIDTRKKSLNVCRIQIRGVIEERSKTKKNREVLLNDRALHALEKARPLTAARSDYVFCAERNRREVGVVHPLRYRSKTLLAHGLAEAEGLGAAGRTTRATRTQRCA